MSQIIDMTSFKAQDVLPHRGIMLLIDRIVESDFDTYAIVEHNSYPERFYFDGHFIGHPIVPGTLILEMMFQACGVLVRLRNLRNTGKMVQSSGVAVSAKSVYFLKEVDMDSTISIKATRKFSIMNFSTFYAVAKVGDEEVCKAELTIYTSHE